jgi:hypothetical protein
MGMTYPQQQLKFVIDQVCICVFAVIGGNSSASPGEASADAPS